jgi:F-type H+-transporting ATPase subunit c
MIRSLFSVRTLVTVAAVALTVLCADVASAADAEKGSAQPLIDLTKYFGVGLTVIGAAFGISKLAASAYESMARQPEAAGTINTAMIIAAALIEGFTFFALYICFAS